MNLDDYLLAFKEQWVFIAVFRQPGSAFCGILAASRNYLREKGIVVCEGMIYIPCCLWESVFFYGPLSTAMPSTNAILCLHLSLAALFPTKHVEGIKLTSTTIGFH